MVGKVNFFSLTMPQDNPFYTVHKKVFLLFCLFVFFVFCFTAPFSLSVRVAAGLEVQEVLRTHGAVTATAARHEILLLVLATPLVRNDVRAVPEVNVNDLLTAEAVANEFVTKGFCPDGITNPLGDVLARLRLWCGDAQAF